MKSLISLSVMLTVFACNPQRNDTERVNALEGKIVELQQKLDDAYKPGLGEFMSSIQVHHAKLWFAGQNENWQLADFEIKELQESVNYIQKYCTDRPETKSIPMIKPALDSMDHAIQRKNKVSFKSSFIFMTQTCNNCHVATQHGFNVIKIPDVPPFTNQVFGNR
jgi:hypothetical protein